MNEKFERDVHAALRPIDPGSDFTNDVLARIGSVEHVPTLRKSTHRFLPQLRWIAAGLAASLVAAVVVVTETRAQREREAGQRAKEQVLEALHMTSAKLNLAYRVIHQQSDSERKPDATQEHDRSGV